MNKNRRSFINKALVGGMALSAPYQGFAGNQFSNNPCTEDQNPNYQKLDAILRQPVFKKELFDRPVIIASVELLKKDRTFLCRVRSEDGAEGISVAHGMMNTFYTILMNHLQDMFVGLDARRLDEIVEKALIYNMNYRYLPLPIGIPLATVEFAILDMMGKIANKPIGELIGTIHNTHVPVYQATEFRERPVEESVQLIKAEVDKYQAQAVKIKVGALMFMTNDLDARGPEGRTEQIIPLIRKTFGDDMPLYADANGYYQDPREAIRVGRLLEEYRYEYFEEPTPCYWHHGTKMVNDALQLPVAGGEQEHSIYGFRWLLANNGLEIVQPNQFYFGGMIRSMKVAQMAHSLGKICTPHLSGGFDYIYMLHFVSAIPNSGPHIEFKGYTDIPLECSTSSLRLLPDGSIKVPTGPGTGVIIDPDYIKSCEVLKKV